MVRSTHLIGFCSLLLACFACKSTGSSGLESATTKGAATAPACAKPQVLAPCALGPQLHQGGTTPQASARYEP